ncbi:hypothetical protein FRC04_004497 [Tulasnella sp. 424]|nr:hypothetical protein FRC04_004497 [Tulasnella sp. 424]
MTTESHKWTPKMSLQQCTDLLCKTPGSPYEIESKLIDGRIQRVYKNLPQSLRHVWLRISQTYADREYIVYDSPTSSSGDRLTYGQLANNAQIAASVFRKKYKVRKGDRVGIVSRNNPEWVVAWWACQLLGAVAVAINAWLPASGNPSPLQFCIRHTECKLLIIDAERADKLQHWICEMSAGFDNKLKGVLVIRHHEVDQRELRKDIWKSMHKWDQVMGNYKGSNEEWKKEPECLPEDYCSIFFTSGTTGLPKGVLSTHRAFITNIPNSTINRARNSLRTGVPLPKTGPQEPQGVSLVASPLFHAMGTNTSLVMGSTAGAKIVLMRKWDTAAAARLAEREKVTLFIGVPYMVMDLEDGGLPESSRKPMKGVSFGGAPTPAGLLEDLGKKFPGALLSQGYGLTETNSAAAGICGQDFIARPMTAGLPCPVNDLLIVDENNLTVLPPGKVGEVWIRGPNIFKCYWKDPEATAKAVTKDGWFRSGDLGYLDEEGFLYIKDRLKDVIIRGGENIDSTTVENAFYADERVHDCAAVGVPDRKLGELVALAVVLKDAFKANVNEAQLLEGAKERLPQFSLPVIILELEEIPRNATGKTDKRSLRKIMKKEWEKKKDRTRVPKSKL